MSVRFILGRAGSGKSLHCFNSIVEMLRAEPLGKPIFLIVPKHQTFTAERELTCTSGLKGFCRARIVSFELLGEQVLSELGGAAVPEVTELGRQMIIGHLLRRHEKELAYFASAARQVGLAAELDATFAELERNGHGAANLANIVSDLKHDPDDPSLVEKLTDLRLLYEKYLAYLGQDRLDPQRRLEQVLQGIGTCKQLQGATVFVDGFLELHEWQRRMLAAVASVCGRIDFTLLMDPKSPVLKDVHRLPDETGIFHKTEETYRRMWFTFEEAGVTPEKAEILDRITRFESPALRHLEQNLFAPRPTRYELPPKIELIEAPDRRCEVDAAARHIRKLILSGMRFRDIAVLMRDLDDYHELINASFSEHEIPYFVDRRRTAAHHPLLQFTRAAVAIALHDWRHDAVMALAKSDLAGLSRDEADELENYVLVHRIRGGDAWTDAEPWAFHRKLTRGREEVFDESREFDSRRMDGLRRKIAERLEPLLQLLGSSSPQPARQMVAELFKTFQRFEVPRTIGGWIDQATQAGQIEQRDEHEQVWSALVDLFDQLVNVIGEEMLTPEDFVRVLETGLEQFDLALTPPTVDQVLVGSIDRTRSLRPRAVILLGMNDGQFPRPTREDAILSDHERQTLRKHRLELSADSQRNLFDERLLGYLALTRASSRLCLTRAMADDESRPQTASPYWSMVRRMFPKLQPSCLSRGLSPETIGTPRQLVTALMQWVREPDSDAGWPALYQWLCDHGECDDAIGVMRRRAWRALSYCNEAALSPELAARLFKSPLVASVSRLETFAACPFQHFMRYGLKVEQREDADVTAIDLGIVCHSILERIVKQMLEQNGDWRTQASAESIKQIAQEVGHELRGELLLSSARNQYILEHIERTIGRVLEAQAAAGNRGKFVPWRTELQFGDNTRLGPLVLRTPGGHELRVRGKIDRVDKTRDGAHFAIIDYKYRGDRLALDWVYHGLSLQLLTYLLVLQRNGSELAKRQFTPVAAFYVTLLRQLQSVRHPDDASEPDGLESHKQFKPRGLIDHAYRELLDAGREGEKAGSLYSRSDGCSADEFAAILRLAEQKLAELADQIIAGQIDAAPYRIAGASPCAHCEYRCICRFDVALNRYHQLPSMKRDQVIERILKEKP